MTLRRAPIEACCPPWGHGFGVHHFAHFNGYRYGFDPHAYMHACAVPPHPTSVAKLEFTVGASSMTGHGAAQAQARAATQGAGQREGLPEMRQYQGRRGLQPQTSSASGLEVRWPTPDALHGATERPLQDLLAQYLARARISICTSFGAAYLAAAGQGMLRAAAKVCRCCDCTWQNQWCC